MQFIFAVQEEFRWALEQARAEVAQHVLVERDQHIGDLGALWLEVSEDIETERAERIQHGHQLPSELVEEAANERNERVSKHIEHCDKTARMFDELYHCLQQAQGVVMEGWPT